MMTAAGFDRLVQFINSYKTPVIVVANTIIALVAIVFISKQVITLMSEVKGKKWNEAGKSFGVIAIIVLIAGLGMFGVIRISKVITPSDSNANNFNIPSASVNIASENLARIQAIDNLHETVLAHV